MPSGPARAAPQTQGANIFATQALSQQSQPEPQYRYSFLNYDTQESAAAGFPEFTQAHLSCCVCAAPLTCWLLFFAASISAVFEHCCVSSPYRLLTKFVLLAP